MLKVDPSKLKIHNHLENNYVIGNKKALFHTMNKYYKLTKQNIFDPTYMRFLNSFYEKAKRLKRQ
jgi:hypothetical protein